MCADFTAKKRKGFTQRTQSFTMERARSHFELVEKRAWGLPQRTQRLIK